MVAQVKEGPDGQRREDDDAKAPPGQPDEVGQANSHQHASDHAADPHVVVHLTPDLHGLSGADQVTLSPTALKVLQSGGPPPADFHVLKPR